MRGETEHVGQWNHWRMEGQKGGKEKSSWNVKVYHPASWGKWFCTVPEEGSGVKKTKFARTGPNHHHSSEGGRQGVGFKLAGQLGDNLG